MKWVKLRMEILLRPKPLSFASKIEPPGLEIRNHLGSFGGDKKITTQLRRTDLRTVQVSRLAFAGTVPLSELLLARTAYLLLSVM